MKSRTLHAAPRAATLLTLLLAGCASLGRGTPHVPGVADTVYYLSARARADGMDTRELAPTLEYGMAVMRRHVGAPDDRAVGRDIVDSTILDSAAFVRHLRDRVAQQRAPFDFAVLYVHGMGTSLHEAWQHTAAARGLAGQDVPWVVFCWPATGSGIAWPRADALLTAAYHRDSVMADRSRGLFTAAFTSVREAVPADRLVLAAHSLGAQLVGETVQDPLLLRTALVDAPVRAMAFLTPDVSLARFRDSLVPALRPLAARRVLYVSRADRALTMARLTRHSERAGLRTTEWLRPAPHLMESVDVTQALTTEGWFQRRFGTHHAIKRQTGLLIDLIQIVGARRSVDCRAQARLGALSRDSVWVLRRVSPHADSLRLCAPYPPSG